MHAATVVAYGRFEDVPAEVFDRSVEINLIGTANVARAALRQFRPRGGGRLVLVGSLLGKIATPYMSSYVTAKWGVHGLARTLQIEARQTPGVEISLVSPGGVDTPVYSQAASYLGRDGRPPPPVDPPEKVARAIVRALDRPRRDVSVGVANPVRDPRLPGAAGGVRPAGRTADAPGRAVPGAGRRPRRQRPRPAPGRRGHARALGTALAARRGRRVAAAGSGVAVLAARRRPPVTDLEGWVSP